MFHYNQCCEGVERTNSTFRSSNLQVTLLKRESESALDGKRLYFETKRYRITRRRTSNPRRPTSHDIKTSGHAIINRQTNQPNNVKGILLPFKQRLFNLHRQVDLSRKIDTKPFVPRVVGAVSFRGNPEGVGGGGTRGNSWWGCAARFFKS